MNDLDTGQLCALKSEVEDLSVVHQIEIMRILMNNVCDMSENVNGTFVVLNQVSDAVVRDIKKYLEYVGFQNRSLEEIEARKEVLIQKYFKE